MACIMTPSNIEVLLHMHTSPSPHPRMDAPAVQQGVRYLMANGLIEPDDRHYRTTAKGKFFIEHLCNIPFPETTYSIPQKD